MPQLDALRAIAVLLVVIDHWFSKYHIFNRFTDNGSLGVTLFFVLSGYLITAILLNSKTEIERGGSAKQAFKTFYFRRSLRIFPIYYLLLIILLVINAAQMQEQYWWHFLYLSNFYMYVFDIFPGQLSHLWSLSVEEQFYLFWPAFIFLVPRSKLVISFVIGIVFATVFRIASFDLPNHMGRYLMPASLDSFCIGALLAYGQLHASYWYGWVRSNMNKLLAAFFLIFLCFIYAQTKMQTPMADYAVLGVYYLLISSLFVLVIMKCSIGITNKYLAPVLNNKGLLYLGKISYGLYLYHNFIPEIYNIEFPEVLEPVSLYFVQLFRLALLVLLATASWYLIEKPLLKLKDKYGAKRPVIKPELSLSKASV